MRNNIGKNNCLLLLFILVLFLIHIPPKEVVIPERNDTDTFCIREFSNGKNISSKGDRVNSDNFVEWHLCIVRMRLEVACLLLCIVLR